jgi:hypothetical protein
MESNTLDSCAHLEAPQLRPMKKIDSIALAESDRKKNQVKTFFFVRIWTSNQHTSNSKTVDTREKRICRIGYDN